MQRKIDEYLASRRIAQKLRADFDALQFHGTSSRSLPSINRHGAVLSPKDLERTGDYRPRTQRGRYEDIGPRPPEDIRDRVVSLTSSIRRALHYAEENRLRRLNDPAYFEGIMSDLDAIKHEYRGVSLGWPSTFSFSNIRAFLSLLRKGYHSAKRVPHFPVIVAVRAPNAPRVSSLDPKVRAEPGEKVLVQVPAHMAYFFVPDERLPEAKKFLWKYKHRVLPLSILYQVAKERGRKVWDE